MSSSAEPVPAFLTRHAARWAEGRPTVSVLVGPAGAGGRAWRRWARQAVLTLPDPADAPAAWVAESARWIDLSVAAVDALARRLDRDPVEFRTGWRAKTAADRARFWDGVHPGPPTPALRTLADFAGTDGPTSALLAAAGDSYPVLRDLVSLVPTAAIPAVLFRPPAGTEPGPWLAGIAPGAVASATGVPAVPTAIAVPAAAWAAYRSAAPELRAKAVLREGEIEVPVHEPAHVARVLTGAGLGREASADVAVLAADGVTDELVAAAVDMIRANVSPPAGPGDGVRDALPECHLPLRPRRGGPAVTTAVAPPAHAVPKADPRLAAFTAQGPPEIFHSVATPTEIWRADPFDVDSIPAPAREAFERLLHRAAKVPAPPAGAVLVLLGESGSGKTHLMRAFRTRAHDEHLGYCAYMQMTTEVTRVVSGSSLGTAGRIALLAHPLTPVQRDRRICNAICNETAESVDRAGLSPVNPSKPH